MIALYIRIGAEQTGRIVFDQRALRIGSNQDNDLVLRDGAAADQHCELALDETDTWRVVGRAEMMIDGRPIAVGSTTTVPDGAKLDLGHYTIILASAEPELSRSPVEAQLLAAILARDEASRDVYADWREEHGHVERAEFVRVQRGLTGAIDANLAARSRELCESPAIDLAWRRRVGRPAIENCSAVGVTCPMEWGGLAQTARPKYRTCEACRETVTYCETQTEASRCGHRRFVIDFAALPNDVDNVSTGRFQRNDEPSARLEIQANEWIATEAWQSGDYAPLVTTLYPGAVLESECHAWNLRQIRMHSIVSLRLMRWEGDRPSKKWVGMFGMGALGFARISQRPGALAALLAIEQFQLPLDRDDGNATVGVLAQLLATAFAREYDAASPFFSLHALGGLLMEDRIAEMDEKCSLSGLELSAPGLNALRPRLGPALGVPRAATFDVSFCTADRMDYVQLLFTRITVAIARVTYALSVSREELGTIDYRDPRGDRIWVGRPFEIAGTPQLAPLVKRCDWGAVPTSRDDL